MTELRYLHFVPRAEDARLVAEAFRVEQLHASPGRIHVGDEVA